MLLLALAAATTSWATHSLAGPFNSSVALRNLGGGAGLALINAAVLGGRLAWILPVTFTGACLAGGATGTRADSWAFYFQPGRDASATALALVLLAAGLVGASMARAQALVAGQQSGADV